MNLLFPFTEDETKVQGNAIQCGPQVDSCMGTLNYLL